MTEKRSSRRVEAIALGVLAVWVGGLYGLALCDSFPGDSDVATPGPAARSAPASRKTAASPVHALAANDVETLYASLGYTLETVQDTGAAAPRIYLASVPRDLKNIPDVRRRKSLFLRILLPLILRVNEEILADRARLERIAAAPWTGGRPQRADREWRKRAAGLYRLKTPDPQALLRRIDIIPPSLALAQGASESGWGTSRFARLGNAVFGQWTVEGDIGIRPLNRKDGATHLIKAFPTLLDAVRAYALNLNSHRAYGALRKARGDARARGERADGYRLASALTKYSERGAEYVDTLHAIMRENKLAAFDRVRLSGAPVEVAAAPKPFTEPNQASEDTPGRRLNGRDRRAIGPKTGAGIISAS